MEMSSAPNAIQLFKEEGKKSPFRQGLSPAVLKGEKSKKARGREEGPKASIPLFITIQAVSSHIPNARRHFSKLLI